MAAHRIIFHASFVSVIVAAFGCLSVAHAETVLLQLRNGDRLTGSVVSQSTNELVISNSWAKELKVPLAEVLARQDLKSTNATPGTLPSPGSPTPPTVAMRPLKPEERTFGARLIQPQSWHGKIDLGLDLGFSETSRELYYGRTKITFAPPLPPGVTNRTVVERLKNTFDLQGTYGRTDKTVSANQVNGSSKTDYDLTKRTFIYNLVGGGYDEPRKINYQYEVGPGFGYRQVIRTNLTLNTELGINFQLQNLEKTVGTVTNTETQQRLSLRFAEDATWTISKKLAWDEKLELFPTVENFNSFRLRFETNVRYSLWETKAGQNIYLTLSLLDLFDTDPAEGVSNNDLQIRSAIGVSF
jgi:hypothetical protein